MNVLVVDDEPIVRMGLRNLVDWERHGLNCIGEASDGLEAWDMIQQETVDIVVTDILMPRMDGLELIRRLKDSSMDVGILVLSCLDDFAYVKEAMKLGAQDYILKPTMEPEELLAIILDIQKQLEEKRQSQEQWNEWQKQLERTKQVQMALRIQSWLEREEAAVGKQERDGASEDPVLNEQDQLLANELFPRGQGLCSIMLYGVPDIPWYATHVHDDGHDSEPITVKWSHNRYLLFYPVQLRWSGQEMHSYVYAKAHEVVTNIMRERSSGEQSADFFVGIGPVMYVLADLQHACHWHERQMNYRFYESSERMVGEPPRTDDKEIELPYDDRNHLLRAIYHDNREAILHCAERLCEHIQIHQPPVSKLFPFITELLNLAISYARDRGYTRMDEYERLYMSTEAITTSTRVGQLCLRLLEALRELGNYKRGSGLEELPSNPFIRKALLYIKENYRQNINTVDIAEHVKLSRSYFSDLYSREMGESLSETITRVRMDEAKRLLSEGELKIYEIAESVGFSDARAFAKSFKKVVGCTPKEYEQSVET